MTQLRLDRLSTHRWRVTFDHPPINLIDSSTVRELAELLDLLETQRDLRVVVFDSADPEFFLAHYDVLRAGSTTPREPSVPGFTPWVDVLMRLSRSPVISVAVIRGCARGAGSEFALACDMRFASRERASLGQFEVGVGAVPGGGPMARLARLAGRGRALEILAGGDDFSGELAERYGYVNRALPDAELDAFVDDLSARLARFDRRALAEIKRLVDLVSPATDDEMIQGSKAFAESIRRPETQGRLTELVNAGLHQRSELERNLGGRL